MEGRNTSQLVGGRFIMPYLQKRRSNYVQKLSWYFLLNTEYKVFSVTLFQTLQPIVETSTVNYQCGFRP
jgi:hypothetical protein